MGKKNRNQNPDFGGDDEDQRGSTQKNTYKSLNQQAKEEAEEAKHKGQSTTYSQALSDSDDDGQIMKKKSKKNKNKKGVQQMNEDEEFEQTQAVPQKKQPADGDGDSQDEADIQKQMETNFEGNMPRKKKHKKGQQDFEKDQEKANILAAAFDEAAEEDEVYARKGGKHHNKKERQQGKNKKNKKQDSDAEEANEAVEGGAGAEEEKVPEDKAEDEPQGFALEVVYCAKCSVPPEYCGLVEKKDPEECKNWLSQNHPALFKQIYNEEAKAGGNPVVDAEEEKQEGDQPKKKSVRFQKDPEKQGIIQVIKLKRGSKKTICQIIGFEYYTKDLKTLASKLGKKFACGSAVATDDIWGECISVQGDIEFLLEEYLEQDKEMRALKIPENKIVYEDKGQKKGRKRN